MNRSFYNGIAGTKTHQYGIDTVANNIANINTVGFKGKEAEFSTIFSQRMAETSGTLAGDDVGLGSRVAATALDIKGGSYMATDNVFDLAIGGEGWFAVQNGKETFYTRKGAFHTGMDHYLNDDQGGYVLGFSGNIFTPDPTQEGRYLATVKSDIPMTGTVEKLLLPNEATMPGQATAKAKVQGNLNPEIKHKARPVTLPKESYSVTIDPATGNVTLSGSVSPSPTMPDPKPGDPITVTLTNAQGKSAEFSTTLDENLGWHIDGKIAKLDPANNGPIQSSAVLTSIVPVPNEAHFQTPIYSKSGEKAFIDMHFTQQIPVNVGSKWNAEIKVMKDAGPYDPNSTYDPDKYLVDEKNNKVYEILDAQQGEITFNESGALVQNTIPALNNDGTPLNLNLGTPYDPNSPNSGYDGLTAMATLPSDLKAETHDGYPQGELKGYAVTADGTIYANFTNGKTSAAAKLPIYHFRNDQGLSGEGGVYFSPTSNSGKATLYHDAAGNLIQSATVRSYSLETSNVRIDRAMTEMIVLQKAFDANAKSITTSDQMIQRAINMKK